MHHQLPPLPFGYNALEPHLDEETLRVHHAVIHKSHVDGANHAEAALAAARADRDYTLIKHWTREAAFHRSGHRLHSIYWSNLRPDGGGEPAGTLREAMERDFGDLDGFRSQFVATAAAVDGAGWALLVAEPATGRLVIARSEKHGDLVEWFAVPILACDLWEHAYFLRYRARRAEYVQTFFRLLDWNDVGARYMAVIR